MRDTDPFSVLELAPTLDLESIKQAYFAAVRRHPPHANPTVFRQVRAAYEQLNERTRLMQAWLEAPLDVDHQLEQWHARFRPRIDAACAQQREQARIAAGVSSLIERCARTHIGWG